MRKWPVIFFVVYVVICTNFFRGSKLNAWFLSSWDLFDTAIPEKIVYDVVIETQDGPRFFTRDVARQWMNEKRNTGPVWRILVGDLVEYYLHGQDPVPSWIVDKTKAAVFQECRCKNFKLVRIRGSLQDHVVWKRELPVEVLASGELP
jgi:hypothetical protein